MQTPYTVALYDLAATTRLGSALAQVLVTSEAQNILFTGTLGAGKTTLARFIVTALPGGLQADIGSPSFTICNIYSTFPRVHHFDLYRLGAGQLEESLEEAFDTPGIITLVEWSERLSTNVFPDDGIVCQLNFSSSDEQRTATFEAIGTKGIVALQLLRAALAEA